MRPPSEPLSEFLHGNARWLAAGFLMTLGSSFGQTFFIAVFSEPLRVEFALSHGEFGAIYMAGTLASALCLTQLGRLADSVAPRRLALFVTLGLAAVCAAMALAASWAMLIGVIFGLRLFGQGLLSHLALTCIARWYAASRGRALAIATLGYPTGEGAGPAAAVALIALIGWRETWGVAGALLVLLFAPALWLLLGRERRPRAAGVSPPEEEEGAGIGGRHWTRAEVLRWPAFWLILPGFLAPSFIVTVFFFLPSHIAETKGWAFEALPQSYWIYALTSIATSLATGAAVDRFGARACLPFYQLPMAGALLLLWWAEGVWAIAPVLALVGVTSGAALTVAGALWAELFGTLRLGGIKALTFAGMVASTAAGPGIAGAIIDLGTPFPEQGLWMAGYICAVSLLFAGLLRSGVLSVAARPATSAD